MTADFYQLRKYNTYGEENKVTLEENRRREQDEHVKFLKEHLCDKDMDSGKSYVFISYKSDDWEVVLHDIVYRLVKEYGLNVYFDGSFDTHNSLWIEQFPENMRHYKCKGVLAFLDDKYETSYATLSELMYSQTRLAANIGEGLPKDKGLAVVPIYLSKPTRRKEGAEGEKDTGLGVSCYEDGTRNLNAESERKLFDKIFKELIKRGILDEAQYLYEVGGTLSKGVCREIVAELIGHLKINENFYEKGRSLDGIVGSIKDACGEEVFSPVVNVNAAAPVKYDNVGKSAESVRLMDEGEEEKNQREKRKSYGNYHFILYGKDYEDKNLKALMLTVFEEVINRHTDKLDQILGSLKCMGEGISISRDAKPSVFRAGKVINVNGRNITIGTSLDKRAVFNYIERLLEICGEPKDILMIEGQTD